MTKHRLISMLIILIMIFTTLTVYADSIDFNAGEKEGIRFGDRDGVETANSDVKNRENTMSSFMQRKVDEYELQLSLDLKNTDYINGFIKGYEETFRKSYIERRKEIETGSGTENTLANQSAGSFGTNMGRIDGYNAYESGKINDWERYVPSHRSLSSMFELDRESRSYEDEFIALFRQAYKISFEVAFRTAKLGEKSYSYEEGLKDGHEYSKELATLNGNKDYLLGLSNSYIRNMPTDREIIDNFNLKNHSREYEDAFIVGFKFGESSTGYMYYYNQAYIDSSNEFLKTPDLNGEEGGRAVGKMKGEYAAIVDITLGKANSWISHKTTDIAVSNEYGLGFQSDNYRDAFIIGYWNEFMKTYNETYKKLQQDSNTVKTYTEKISIDGKASIGIPGDDKFLVDIDPGTYYNDVIVTINSIPTSHVNANSDRHTQASEIYGLKIMNLAGTYDEDKKITIKFKSYGDNVKYGIYKYHYNKWIYIPSIKEGDYLTADININNINLLGNIYAVRVDNELPIFHEVRGHWGRDEIHTYVKREVIYGYPDKTFKPNKEISRGEFVTMLSRLYDWYPPFNSTNITMFKDYMEFGYAEKAISYASYYKIVGGYPDQTFRPHNPITYKEVEIIMSRVLGDKDFKWDKYSEKLLYEKRYRSKSKDSMNNKITRAEFTFLLHQLNEWQY